MVTQSILEQLSFKVIGCILEVHKFLGPGLLESVYHSCLLEEMKIQQISFIDKPYVPVLYKNNFLGGNLQMDILVEGSLVLELKAVEIMNPLYKAQLLTYLKLSGFKKGILVNFNSELVKGSIHSMVTPDFFELPKQ